MPATLSYAGPEATETASLEPLPLATWRACYTTDQICPGRHPENSIVELAPRVTLCMYIFCECFRFRDAVNKQKSVLLAMGYPTFTLEDFHDSVGSYNTHFCKQFNTHTTHTLTHNTHTHYDHT